MVSRKPEFPPILVIKETYVEIAEQAFLLTIKVNWAWGISPNTMRPPSHALNREEFHHVLIEGRHFSVELRDGGGE